MLVQVFTFPLHVLFNYCIQVGAKMAQKIEKSKKGKDMDDLKRELELTEHKIPIEDLYKRLKSDPTRVSCVHKKRKFKHLFY